MKRISKKTRNIAIRAGAGVLTAAALAGAAAYLLSDKQQRTKMKAWVVKAKKEIARNVKVAKRLSGAEYKRIVDRAAKRYGSLHNVNAAEVMKAAQEMKTEWQRIQKEAKKMAKKAK